jgi:exosortase/archaeosortase family protein
MAQKALAFVELLVLLVVPFSEFIFLRIVTVFNPPGSFPSQFMTVLLLVLFFIILVSRDLGPFRLQKKWLALNIVMIGLHLFVLNHPDWSKDTGSGRQLAAFPYLDRVLALGILGSSFLVFAGPGRWLQAIKGKIPALFFLSLAVFSQILYPRCLGLLWTYSSGMTTQLSIVILKSLGYAMIPVTEPFALKHSLLSLKIYAPCSGLEGITFFIVIMSLVMTVDHRKFRISTIVTGYLSGIFYMWLLNVVRIVSFFVIGVWASGRWGKEAATDLVVHLFHANAGWIIYSIGIVLYMALFLKFGARRKSLSPSPGNG